MVTCCVVLELSFIMSYSSLKVGLGTSGVLTTLVCLWWSLCGCNSLGPQPQAQLGRGVETILNLFPPQILTTNTFVVVRSIIASSLIAFRQQHFHAATTTCLQLDPIPRTIATRVQQRSSQTTKTEPKRGDLEGHDSTPRLLLLVRSTLDSQCPYLLLRPLL